MDRLLKLNVTTINNNNNNSSSIEFPNIWHGRLEHVNYDTVCQLIHIEHILSFQINSKHKCETYVEAKLARTSFQSLEYTRIIGSLIYLMGCLGQILLTI